MAMESHRDIRKEIPAIHFHEQKMVSQIRDIWGIREFTEEEIYTVSGIIEVNCFGFDRDGRKGRGLYPITSLMAHDCCPNVRTAIHPKTYVMTARALRDIEQGESLTISYVDYILVIMDSNITSHTELRIIFFAGNLKEAGAAEAW